MTLTRPVMRSLRATFFSSLLALAACAAGTEAKVTSATQLFETEDEAASAGSSNREKARPIASLAEGDVVRVVGDTYGKDYWACRVQTNEGTTGWVLCTALDYRGHD